MQDAVLLGGKPDQVLRRRVRHLRLPLCKLGYVVCALEVCMIRKFRWIPWDFHGNAIR